MELSVIIPCYNAGRYIGAQLAALIGQRFDGSWEVVVADNGSTDDTIEVLRRYQQVLSNLHVVDASDRPGSAHARNVGAHFATGESLIFVDADDEVGTGYLTAISAALADHDFVASRFEIDKLNPSLIGAKLRNPQAAGLQKIAYPPYLSHAGGSGLAIKREIHHRVDGFDESLPRLQDTDYCFRVQSLGCELHFAADAVVHVRYNSQPVTLFRQARLWAEYNELMYQRYGGGAQHGSSLDNLRANLAGPDSLRAASAQERNSRGVDENFGNTDRAVTGCYSLQSAAGSLNEPRRA